MNILFNKPYMTGKELDYITEAHANNMLAGDGPFTRRCHAWLEQTTGCSKALLTHSCTAALEMAAMLADIQPGDEVIMPSTPLFPQPMPLCCAEEYRCLWIFARIR